MTNKELSCYLACIIFLLVIIGVKGQVICTTKEAWCASANYALVLRGQPAVMLKIWPMPQIDCMNLCV